jgi:hypothetical protein
MARVVVKYLEEHPERLHQEGFIEVTKALANVFLCRGGYFAGDTK